MLTTQPYLRTRRPSPTTVEYFVSTAPPLTYPLRLLILLTIVFRIFTALSALLILYARFTALYPPAVYSITPALFTNEYIYYILGELLASRLGQLASALSLIIPLPCLLPLLAIILYLTILRPHVTESLLVLRGLGIQTSSSSRTYMSSPTTRFIPTEKIQDIFVNEAFRGFEVRYYLVVVVEGEEDVVVVFPGLLPRRNIVEKVWRGARGCLYEPVREGREKNKENRERS